MGLIPLPWKIAVGAAFLAAYGGFFFVKGLNYAANERLEAALETEIRNGATVTRYVEKITKIPGPTVIRERLVAGVCHEYRLPGAGRFDAAETADAVAGRGDEAGRAAESLRNARLNQEQLDALHEVLRGQVK